MSKNLFDYAKKELSQDGFLMWLIDSYNDENEEIRNVSRSFIEFLTGISKNEKIVEVWVKPQWCKIDVTAFITTDKKEKVGLFIEDKTMSSEHNQLDRYNHSIENIESWEKGKLTKIVKVYYKTSAIEEWESKKVNDAGWKECIFSDINNFWKKYQNSSNLIIKQYAQHVCKLYNDSNSISIPKDNNIVAWKSYFSKVIFPIFKDKVSCWVSTTRYNYCYFCVRPLGRGDESMPYLEIRSRDCLDSNFNSKILMYGVDFTNNPDGLNEIRSIIRSRENLNIFKGNYGAKQNKQVAHMNKGTFSQHNDEEFVSNISLAINEYLEIVKFWK